MFECKRKYEDMKVKGKKKKVKGSEEWFFSLFGWERNVREVEGLIELLVRPHLYLLFERGSWQIKELQLLPSAKTSICSYGFL